MWTFHNHLNVLIPVLLLLGQAPRQTEAAGQAELYALMDYLFTGYKPEVRPYTAGESTYVFMALQLLSIQNLDEKAQVLETALVIEATWLDDYLSWDEASYGGIEYFIYPHKKLWLPDIIIENTVESQHQLGYNENPVIIYSNGTVKWFPSEIFKTACDIDITYYPFDTQLCSVIFSTWVSTYEDIDLDPGGDEPISLEHFSASGTWSLVTRTMTAEPNAADRTRIKFTFKLKRLRTYYVMNVVLPVLFLSFCASGVFYLPADAGEKIGMSITVLLAYAVYLSIIAENMPQTSLQISILSVYLNLLLGLTAAGVVMSVLVLHFHHRSDELKIGKKTLKYTRRIRNFLKMNPNLSKKNTKLTSLKSKQVGPQDTTLSPSRVAFVPYDEKRKPSEAAPLESKDDEEEITWQKVAESMDRVMFYISSFFIAITTVLFLSVLAIGGLLV